MSLRIVFAGTPEFAAHFLKLVHNSQHEVVAVYTQPDRPAGRGKKLTSSAVKQLALTLCLPVFQPLNFKQQSDVNLLKQHNADIMLVVAYGLLLPKPVLEAPASGCINVHASLLPRWRGAAPIQRAIAAGDTESGVTIMQMDQGLDTGDILSIARCPIHDTDTAADLHDRLAQTGETALLQTLTNIAQQTLEPRTQNARLACYAHKLDKVDAKINWHQSAVAIDRNIRAFFPFPIAFTELAMQRIRVHAASFQSEQNVRSASTAALGSIVALDKQGIWVQAANGVVCLEKLQLAGKKPTPSTHLIQGYPDLFKLGVQFKSDHGAEATKQP